MSLSAEQIKKDYETFRGLCGKCGEDRSEKILKMVDELEERIIECPASTKDEFHLATMGGWLNHSLRCLSFLLKLTKTFEVEFPKESLIISGIFHDANKLGTPTQPYYIPETEDWRIRKGYTYKINSEIRFMDAGQRGLYLLQHYGIQLKEDEYLAILLNDGCSLPANASYSLKEPELAVLVHFADKWSCLFEKKNNL